MLNYAQNISVCLRKGPTSRVRMSQLLRVLETVEVRVSAQTKSGTLTFK